MRREILKNYKLSHTSPRLDHNTNRQSAGTILAIRKDTYKKRHNYTSTHYITAATLTPHGGSPIIAISAYMPQIHTKKKKKMHLTTTVDKTRHIFQTSRRNPSHGRRPTCHPMGGRHKIPLRAPKTILRGIWTQPHHTNVYTYIHTSQNPSRPLITSTHKQARTLHDT